MDRDRQKSDKALRQPTLSEVASLEDTRDNPTGNPKSVENTDSLEEDIISETSKSSLNARQQQLYAQEMSEFYEWMCTSGRDPSHNQGLATTTASNYISWMDKVFRRTWERRETTTVQFPPELADEYCTFLSKDQITKANGKAYSVAHKRKVNDTIQKYHEWREETKGGKSWDPPVKFNDRNHNKADSFTIKERRKLKEAVLTYDTLPTYSDCSPEQRERLKIYLSQRLEIPKEEVSPSDWKRVNTSWERPSLLWTTFDTGLRPIEVERAVPEWLRLEKGSIFIPKEEAAKNRDNWEVALHPRTVRALKRWIAERAHLTKYDDTEHLWLTRNGNPWSSRGLNYFLRQVCDEAGIDQTNRWIVWYSIRHTVGEYMTDRGGLAETNAQLRHESLQSTLRYTDPSLSTRESTLEELE